MRIWLATVGEPLPIDGDDVRLLRTGQFAQWLSDRGHDVVYWTGAMDHYGKKLRSEDTRHHIVNDRYRIVLLKGRIYRRTISFDRLMNHREVAADFAKEAVKLPPPDVIVTSFPTEELSRKVADYAAPRGIPFVIDARDFWPDIFSEILPGPLRFLSPVIFAPMEWRTRRIFFRASAVSGMTETAMEWALRKAGRARNRHDFWHPFTYAGDGDADADVDVTDFPDPSQIDISPSRFKLCFFGTHSHRVNLEMFIDSFRRLQDMNVDASIMLCGKGAVTDQLKERARGLRNVFFPGWLNASQMQAIMQISDAGALPYNSPDFFMNLPNKVVEYLHGGLPVFSCTDGEVRNLIETEGCGFWCEPDVQAISDRVAEVAGNPTMVERARGEAKRVYKARFDRDAVFAAVLDRLRELTADKQGPDGLP